MKVLWGSEQRAGWKGYFYPDFHPTKIITGKIVLLQICLISFLILMCFIIYIMYYTEIHVHN